MAKKRAVFLFGSGAALAWNAPTTSELTELVRNHGFRTTGNTTTITEFIYSTLLAHGYPRNDVDFETIISVIEELVVYYSQFSENAKTPSLMTGFLSPCFENELLNYSIQGGGPPTHGYYLQIPSGVDYAFSKPSFHNETPPQFFFQQLLLCLLTNIGARIDEYAHHTTGHSVIDVNADISKLFVAWMTLLSNEHTLRLYTLNYDRIFKILLVRSGLPVFEGFDCGEHVIGGFPLRANVRKILIDTESNIHYNLHGSANWEVLDLDQKLLPNAEIVLSPAPTLSLVNGVASAQVERGKTLVLSSIITGYQKAQRGMITPFRQMQSAFDRDCCVADDIYVVGYSFRDAHIDESLKTAIRHNDKLRITIIDPNFITNKMDYQFALRFFPFRSGVDMKKKVSDSTYSYFDGAFVVRTLGFEQFLKSQLAP